MSIADNSTIDVWLRVVLTADSGQAVSNTATVFERKFGRGSVIVLHHNSGDYEIDASRLVGSAQGVADRINEVQRGGSRNIFA